MFQRYLLLIALGLSAIACRTQAHAPSPASFTDDDDLGAAANPPLCDPGGEEYGLRRIDGTCRLVNEFGYRIRGRARPRPDWHTPETGEAHTREPAHPVLCGQGCVTIELTLPEWLGNDDPEIQLAPNPTNIWSRTYFPTQCHRTEAGMTCRVRLFHGATTFVHIPRYIFRVENQRLVPIRGAVMGTYRGNPICVSRVGGNVYAIQAPLVDTTGEVMGSSHAWCEVYSHP